MEKLNSVALGSALAITLALTSIVCAITVVIWPDATFNFFGAFLHGLDLTAIRSATPVNLGRAVYGAVCLGVLGFFAGLVFAAVYNLFNSK